MSKNIPFEDRLEVIQAEINRRRPKWQLSTMDFEDASQIILLRVFVKYHLYNPEKGEFTHWLNRLITSAIKNIWRDNLTKFSRPCILQCRFNLGNNSCGYTPSGKQCEECPLYRKWKERKEDHFNVKQNLPLENHAQEVNNIQQDSIDIQGAKDKIDIAMKRKLKPFEWNLYSLLYIENKSPEEVGKILKYKPCKNSSIPGYQQIKKFQKKVVILAKEIIEDENLA